MVTKYCSIVLKVLTFLVLFGAKSRTVLMTVLYFRTVP